jgi:hypothetical protein
MRPDSTTPNGAMGNDCFAGFPPGEIQVRQAREDENTAFIEA